MLALCYLIHGGEPLQTEEYISAIKENAAKQGYTNSMVFDVNIQFNWEELLNKCQNLDLFAERSVVELRLHSENIGKTGFQALERLLREQSSDICTIIRAPKLKAQTLNSTWAQYIQKNGKVQFAREIPATKWRAWVQHRLQQAGFIPTMAAVDAVSSCYEGSLIAAAQCIDRLKNILPTGNLDVDQVKPFLDNSTHFSIYELNDAAINGDLNRTFNIFLSLRSEGVDPVLILWGITREIRNLLQLRYELQQGKSLAQSAQNLGIWRERLPSIKLSLDRLTAKKLQNLLKLSKVVDGMIKGMTPGNAWEPLLSMCLTLAGSKSTLNMEELYI